jgi:hypothetical protein
MWAAVVQAGLASSTLFSLYVKDVHTPSYHTNLAILAVRNCFLSVNKDLFQQTSALAMGREMPSVSPKRTVMRFAKQLTWSAHTRRVQKKTGHTNSLSSKHEAACPSETLYCFRSISTILMDYTHTTWRYTIHSND